MSATWATVLALTVATVATKAVGPVFLGGKDLPSPFTRVIELLAPAILSALVFVGTFTESDGSLTIDARAGGLAAALAVLSFDRKALAQAGIAAATTAAILRLIA